jgi:hypothetical protein
MDGATDGAGLPGQPASLPQLREENSQINPAGKQVQFEQPMVTAAEEGTAVSFARPRMRSICRAPGAPIGIGTVIKLRKLAKEAKARARSHRARRVPNERRISVQMDAEQKYARRGSMRGQSPLRRSDTAFTLTKTANELVTMNMKNGCVCPLACLSGSQYDMPDIYSVNLTGRGACLYAHALPCKSCHTYTVSILQGDVCVRVSEPRGS